MISNAIMLKIYDILVCNGTISDASLNEFGLTQFDIDTLIDEEYIKKVCNDLYGINSLDKLIDFGKLLVICQEYDNATLYFKKAIEIDSKNFNANYQLFIRYIQCKNYEEAFKCIDVLLDSDDENFIIDLDFYMYLLSIITDIPDKYKNHVDCLSYTLCKIPEDDYRYSDIDAYNKIRSAAINKRFAQAIKILNEVIKENDSMSIHDVTLKTLLSQAYVVENKSRKRVQKLISEKNYTEVIKYLNKKRKQHKLSLIENTVYYLTKQILNIKRNHSIPVVKKGTPKTVYEAVQLNDFERALTISNNFSKNNQKELNFLHSLLVDLNNEINQIKNTINNDIKDISHHLHFNEFDIATNLINNYLNKYDKSNYKFIMMYLMKVSIITNDLSFTPVLDELKIIDDSYKPNVYNFISTFHKKSDKGKKEVAKIYLDIIIGICEIEDVDIDINSLKKLIDKPIKDRNFFNKQRELLINKKGAIILDVQEDSRIQNILSLAEEYPDIYAFTISDNGSKKIVFKYSAPISYDVDIKRLISDAAIAYKTEDYDLCINNYLTLLQIYNKPNKNIYTMIGLSYFKVRQKKLAIKYLTIAKSLANSEGIVFEYDNLLSTLMHNDNNNRQDIKYKEFKSDFIRDICGISNFPDINLFICESGLDVESACKQLNLSSDVIQIIKLIYAREYYKISNMKKGDLFIKSVEMSPFKNTKVKKLLEDVKKNKNLYRYKKDKDSFQLSLKLYPNSK